MIKNIKVEICDLCDKELPTRKMKIPVYRTFDSTEGNKFYSSKRYLNETLDLCDSCLEKITLVHSVGVQCERYELERGGINEYRKNI